MNRGLVHVLSGNGKGKTTTAIGLVLRAAGSGAKTFFAQFIKGGEYSEIVAFRKFSDLITVEQFGLGKFTDGDPDADDIIAAQNGLKRLRVIMAEKIYDMIVLDEINVAVKFGMITTNDLLELIVNKPRRLELIITGRYVTPAVIKAADSTTIMKPIKHYYKKGVAARIGIEK